MLLPIRGSAQESTQPATGRTPNLGGSWTAAPGVVYLDFVHRFEMSDVPLRKITNSPTFLVATGLTGRVDAGFNWASASDLVPAYPNEWELFGRAAPLRQAEGAPLDLALAADYATLIERSAAERPAWGAGLQVGVPYTPHSLSLHVTNVSTATLEGRSRGSRTLWGFGYTVPITLSRYLPRRGASPVPPVAGEAMPRSLAAKSADTVRVAIESLRYSPARLEIAPGTTVVWTNADPVVHTVTAADGTFDSRDIEPGRSWSRTFREAGSFEYACTPHPFMKGTVVVGVEYEVGT